MTVRVFVTGGAGFIGSHVVRRLVERGDEVVCLVRESTDTARIDELDVERTLGDVRDVGVFARAARSYDATIHLAAPGGWSADAVDIIEVGTRNALWAVAEASGHHRLVLVSSTAAINASDDPHMFDEAAEFTIRDPKLSYAIAKHRAEQYAHSAFERGVDVVIVNPSEVYGPNDTQLGTAANLIDFATSRPVLVCDGGTSIVHVEDAANGIVAALDRGRSGERYILGGDNVTIRQLAELVHSVIGRERWIVELPRRVARLLARFALQFQVPMPFDPHVVPYATRYWFMDNTKARRELGLEFRGARATVESTIDWLRATGRLAG